MRYSEAVIIERRPEKRDMHLSFQSSLREKGHAPFFLMSGEEEKRDMHLSF
jgi:hypothetical protein